MIIPVPGASDYVFDVSTSSGLGSFTTAGRDPRRATDSIEVRAVNIYDALETLVEGDPVEDAGSLGMDIGTSVNNNAEALNTFVVEGLTTSPTLDSIRIANSSLIASEGISRLTIEVSTSRTSAAHSYSGVDLHGRRVDVAELGQTVRAKVLSPAENGVDLHQTSIYRVAETLTIGGPISSLGRSTVTLRSIDGFLIIADLISSTFVSGPVSGYYPSQDINVVLKVNGSPVDITSFDFQKADDKLGGVLNATIAVPDPSLVPIGASVDLLFEVTDSSGVVHEIDYLENTKLSGRNFTVQWRNRGPGDEVTITCVDVIEDRFGLAPRRPVVMFDPNLVSITDVTVNPKDALIDDVSGSLILPIIEPVHGLMMYQALNRAYTGQNGGSFMTPMSPSLVALMSRISSLIGGGPSYTTVGLGFSGVITNIPNYKIERVTFSAEGGWHDGVAPFVGMFGPLYFTRANYLYIIDGERALPPGFTPRTVPIDDYTTLGDTVPYREAYNAVIATYQVHEVEYPHIDIRPTFKVEVTDNGLDFGSPGFTETTTTTQTDQIVDGDTGEVLDELLNQQIIETRISIQAGDGSFVVQLGHREVLTQRYAAGLKTGHHKEVFGLITSGPDASLSLVKVLIENCEVDWTPDGGNAGRYIQSRSVTSMEGLIYTSTETKSAIDPLTGIRGDVQLRYPALVANESGIITDDGTMGFGPTRTITETLKAVNASTTDVQIVDIDLVSGTIKRSTTQPRSGISAINALQNRSKSRLFRDLTSESAIGPRIPISLNAGELPLFWVRELSHRLLARASNPPDDFALSLAGMDFAIDRGSVLRGQLRNNTYSPSILVRAIGVKGQNLGREGHRISMTVGGVELPS
jgi:hypothetical protein